MIVDWWEVWSADYWRSYLGAIGGRIGCLVQWLGARTPHQAVCYSRLHAGRLRALGGHNDIQLVRSIFPAISTRRAPAATPPFILFAGRLIPDKQADLIVPALARARRDLPALRAVIAERDRPERDGIRRAVAAHGLDEAVDLPGFLPQAALDDLLASALCLVLPSRREGYGLAVLEAAAAGVPSVVVAGPDNAAVEWIVDGVNGAVAPSAAETDLASAMLRIHEAGGAIRASTAAWFDDLRARAAQAPALEAMLTLYHDAARTRRA